MEEKIYYGPTIDLDKEKVVSDEGDKKILDLVRHLEMHRSEIKELFFMLYMVNHSSDANLSFDSPSIRRNLIRKFLSIEIHEFALGCWRLDEEIKEAVEKINGRHKNAVLKSVNKSSKGTLNEALRFSIELDHRTDLDQTNMSDNLRHEFERNGIQLSQNASVEIVKIGKEWTVSDENEKCVIWKAKGKLVIQGELFKLIKEARDQVAAHKFTDERGEYISIGQLMRHLSHLKDDNLKTAWNIAESAFEELKAWTEEKINRNLLVLLISL